MGDSLIYGLAAMMMLAVGTIGTLVLRRLRSRRPRLLFLGVPTVFTLFLFQKGVEQGENLFPVLLGSALFWLMVFALLLLWNAEAK